MTVAGFHPSLNYLEELVNAMGEWTEHMGALDVRVSALEEQDEEDVNKMEALDKRVAAL